jgi:hypothetical protein
MLLKLSLMSCLKPTSVGCYSKQLVWFKNLNWAHFTTADNQLCSIWIYIYIHIFEVLINVLCLLTKYKSYSGHRTSYCTYLLNVFGLEKQLGRADLQRMFHNVTARLKWEDLYVVVLQYLDLVYCLCVSASSQGLWWRNRLCARLSPPISWGSNPVGDDLW